jgi:hypothetical protein
VIAFEMYVPVNNLYMFIGGHHIDFAALQFRGLPLADHYDGQRATSLEDRSQMAWTLRIEVLSEHDGCRKGFIKCTDQSGKRTHTAGGRPNYDQVV